MYIFINFFYSLILNKNQYKIKANIYLNKVQIEVWISKVIPNYHSNDFNYYYKSNVVKHAQILKL